MAPSIRITCITKTDRESPYERISHVGGVNQDGEPWKMTLADAIASIKKGKCSFYVEPLLGSRVDVIIVGSSLLGYEYLKTESDSEQSNNLLSLDECPRFATLLGGVDTLLA